MRAIEVAKGPGPTVPAGTSLRQVAAVLAAGGLRAVVVLGRDGTPAGIVTERDLVVRGLAWKLDGDTPVEAVMTAELVTAEPSASTRSVYRLLNAHGIRQVPLVTAGRVVGIVDRGDLTDEMTTEVLAALGPCPRCQGQLRPVSTTDATNFLCLSCRSCWHYQRGTFVPVETRTCSGCPEHNFCRFPLIDHGVDLTHLVSTW